MTLEEWIEERYREGRCGIDLWLSFEKDCIAIWATDNHENCLVTIRDGKFSNVMEEED